MASPDHAATVRAFLDNCVPGLTTPDVADAQAALDALVAALDQAEHERDEAETTHFHIVTLCKARAERAERQRDEARLTADGMARAPYGEFESMRERAERAERQRDQAIEALREITETRAGAVTADLMLEIARDVLAAIEKDTA